MTAWGWAALGLALWLVPLGDPLLQRLHVLGVRGRLVAPGSHLRRPSWRAVPEALASGPLVGGVALALVTVRAGPTLGVAAGLVAATATHLAIAAARGRASDRAAARLLSAVRVIVAELEAGAASDAALQAAAETDPSRAVVLNAAVAAGRAGGDVGAVLADDRALRQVGQAWTLAAVAGAPVATVLDRVAADLAARAEQQRVVSTALAGARSSAVVLAGLPVVGVALGIGMDSDPLGFLLRSPPGQLVCLVGVVLDVAGLLWTRRLAATAAVP